MKAKDFTGSAPGGKREKLINKIPLDTPYVIQIFPMYSCNFRCVYCGIFNKPKKDRYFISDKVKMSFDLFKKFVHDSNEFPSRVKVLRFVGIGEPLLHPEISNMVGFATAIGNFIDREIITNGSLLTSELLDNLLTDGLSRLIISIQGINSESYEEISKVKIDFKEFVDNIKYFYGQSRSANCKVYIKIVDIALKNEDEKKKFFDIFGNMCDKIAVENTVPIHEDCEFGEDISNKKFTQFGKIPKDLKICPQCYYHLQINPDGRVIPCYSFKYPIILGDINKESIVDIWNGGILKNFRDEMIKFTKNKNEVCNKCKMSKYRYFKEDDLDDLYKG